MINIMNIKKHRHAPIGGLAGGTGEVWHLISVWVF